VPLFGSVYITVLNCVCYVMLYKPRCTNSKRSHFFACRVINIWNGLPSSTDFSSLNAFKRAIFKTDLSEHLICNA